MMDVQDKKAYDDTHSFEYDEGQLALLSCNKVSSSCPSLSSSELPHEAFASLDELGLVLKSVYARMRREGYDIVDGAVIKVDTKS